MKTFVDKIQPEVNKVYFINKHTLFHVLDGHGTIEVDFKNYANWQDKLIYLDKGQYIKFLSDNFIVRRIEFEDPEMFKNKNVRVLFKHLLSLGYINFTECIDCQRFLDDTLFEESKEAIIDVSSEQWFWQNPFGAEKDEYQIIFDVKDIVDDQHSAYLNASEIVEILSATGYSIHNMFQDKIGISVKRLIQNKRVLESKKQIAFTEKSIQQISYDQGFNDPSYFNRFFLRETGMKPMDFRNNSDYIHRESFADDILGIIRDHHKEEKHMGYYADQMNMSIKTLSRKVKQKLNVSFGELIKNEVIASSKKRLMAGMSVKEVSKELHFEEANHFTRFFKNATGITPTEFQKKYNS